MDKILVIDDEKAICSSLKYALNQDYEVLTATDSEKALHILLETDINLVLLDLKLKDESGLDLLLKIKKEYADIPVIIMTAYSSIKSSVDAIKQGAYYYLTKPIDMDELAILLEKALEYQKLNSKVRYLNQEMLQRYSLGNIIGKSQVMRSVYDLVEKVKDIDSNVLITGESGTGKELIARAIHYLGKRKDYHFEVLNCAAIPTHLLESELFGYEKGAFTGATSRKSGKFELAENGTIFLDEIGDMDYNLQAKVLRVLQNKEVSLLGSIIRRKIDVRVLAATNKDLEKEIAKGNFREDLYYRLNVIPIKVPPLRERKEDIPLLVEKFLDKFCAAFGKPLKGIDNDSLELLENYDYKGNVRELENILERAVALSSGSRITVEDLPVRLKDGKNIEKIDPSSLVKVYVGDSLREVEIKIITRTMEACQGNKKKTAEILGISERGLHYKFKEYNL